MEDWTVAFLVGDASQARTSSATGVSYGNQPVPGSASGAINNGQSAETPQIQGKVSYAHDFWGKAAYYGKPTPFTIQFVGGWQRSVMRTSLPGGGAAYAAAGFGENALSPLAAMAVRANHYVNPWLAMGSLFIPVIPTQSANLAGTASILTQWWIGQGVETFGFSGVAGNKYRFSPIIAGNWMVADYNPELLNKFGGFVEGQYYFNNQWFVNGLYAISKAYGVNRSGAWGAIGPVNDPKEMVFTSGNEASMIQQISATLWYRPIQAIKFGMQYSYVAANYFQQNTTITNPNNSSNFGDNHRVEFVGFFYFYPQNRLTSTSPRGTIPVGFLVFGF